MMNQRNRATAQVMGLAALTSTLTWGFAPAAEAQASPVSHLQSNTRAVNLEAGTVIPVRLSDPLSSNNSKRGDTFTTTLRTGDEADYSGLPAGTKIEGVVQSAKPQQDKDPGALELAFQRLRLPDGRSYAVQGSLIGLDEKSVTKSRDGRLVAKPGHRNDRLTYLGYGAGAGLIAGVLTKHTLEDTLIGGGLGYLFGSLQKGGSNARDVSLKAGTEFGVRLDRALGYSATTSGYRNSDAYRNSEEDATRLHRAGGNGNTDANLNPRQDAGGAINRQDAGDLHRNDSRDNQDAQNRDRQAGSDVRDAQGNANGSYNADNTTDIGVLVGDQNVRFDPNARPIYTKGMVLVPAIPVLNAAHIRYSYDAGRQQITVNGDNGPTRITANSSIAVVNNTRRVRLQSPARRLNGVLYVPLKFLEAATNYTVAWDASSRTAVFTAPDTAR